ncbi:hypothetical protein PPERSA_06989 [Pseudocohnilembus persalinus]|uniref:Uncharacterized protein n=1 Tax=Pseudocohnilembus persalinus TaxID=266149 RepID=A0A0V0QYR7_PSEPJ|nr:hypothetical protein PPERSA_06989 [Pseudocohnilembus persalinus]|eukprot:KRX07374.1 hypothetical protein PPERSA_06989 [Pseudocohnilembus persalinus]
MRKREAKAQKLQNQFKENVKDPNNLVELKKKEAEELRLAQIEQGIISDNQKEENLESEDSFSGSDSEPSIDGLDTDTYKKVMFKSFTVAQKKKKRKRNQCGYSRV